MWHIQSWTVTRPDFYTASHKHSAPKKAHSRPYKTRFIVHIYCRRSLFLRHSCAYVCTHCDNERIWYYNDGTHCECTTKYGFANINFEWNVANMRLFSSRDHEFLIRKTSAKVNGSPLQKFPPRETTRYTVYNMHNCSL